MSRSTPHAPDSLKRRISTRLAWLQVTHRDFAAAIGMHKSQFSRMLAAANPRTRTMERVAQGLGLDLEDLIDVENTDVLLIDHPALGPDTRPSDRVRTLKAWFESLVDSGGQSSDQGRRPDADRHARRMEIRTALVEGRFSIEFVRPCAERWGVSTSQIYADRTLILRLEPDLVPDDSSD